MGKSKRYLLSFYIFMCILSQIYDSESKSPAKKGLPIDGYLIRIT